MAMLGLPTIASPIPAALILADSSRSAVEAVDVVRAAWGVERVIVEVVDEGVIESSRPVGYPAGGLEVPVATNVAAALADAIAHALDPENLEGEPYVEDPGVVGTSLWRAYRELGVSPMEIALELASRWPGRLDRAYPALAILTNVASSLMELYGRQLPRLECGERCKEAARSRWVDEAIWYMLDAALPNEALAAIYGAWNEAV